MKELKKTNRTYYVSVEGDTEERYFKWLQKTINELPNFNGTITFKIVKKLKPISAVKKLNVLNKTEIYHIFDRESESDEHVKKFTNILDEMSAVSKSGKTIKYKAGYSNFTFDLWIILHKKACNGSLADRSQYLSRINNCFDESFISMDTYKEEDNFKRILGKLSFDDVKDAINRSKQIMKTNKDNGYTEYEYKKYKYYKENPSLSVWELVNKVLSECGLI